MYRALSSQLEVEEFSCCCASLIFARPIAMIKRWIQFRLLTSPSSSKLWIWCRRDSMHRLDRHEIERCRRLSRSLWKTVPLSSCSVLASRSSSASKAASSFLIACSTVSSKPGGRERMDCDETLLRDGVDAAELVSSMALTSTTSDSQSLTARRSCESWKFVANDFGSTFVARYRCCVGFVGIFLSSFFVIFTNPLRLTSPYHCSFLSWPRISSKAPTRSSTSS